MNIEGNSYLVKFDGKGTLTMSGKLAAMPEEYEEIEAYFEKVLVVLSDNKISELVLDLRTLSFLNSSGIKSLCVSLLMEADDVEGLHLTIRCSKSVTWQVETIPTLKELMDNLEIVFE